MSLETRHFTNGDNEPEHERRVDVWALLRDLDEEAGRVGIRLEKTDFVHIGRDEVMKLQGKLEMVIGAIAIAAGFAVAHEATHSLFQSGPEQIDAVRLLTRFGLAATAREGVLQASSRDWNAWKPGTRSCGGISVSEN
jgi:hypothetical protein